MVEAALLPHEELLVEAVAVVVVVAPLWAVLVLLVKALMAEPVTRVSVLAAVAALALLVRRGLQQVEPVVQDFLQASQTPR